MGADNIYEAHTYGPICEQQMAPSIVIFWMVPTLKNTAYVECK